MFRSRVDRAAPLITALAMAGAVACRPSANSPARPDPGPSNIQTQADLIRTTEHERLRALVGANVARARQLHADDFQLINPAGEAVSKEGYLGRIASGEIDYLLWEPDSIAVRLYEGAAIIRYRSQIEIVVRRRHVPRQRYWHTDLY